MAEMTVRVEGTVTTSGGTTGVGGSSANPGFTSITQGGNVANVAVPGPNLGAGLIISSGSLVSATTLNALTAVGPGVVVDFGSGKARITGVTTATTGVTAGATTLMVSQDNVNYFPGTAQTFTAPGVKADTAIGAWRYARVDITTLVVGGTVSATLMAS
jgi:hypothetical protein